MKNETNSGQILAAYNFPVAVPPVNAVAAGPAPMPVVPQPLVYDINEAAAALNVSTKTIRRLLRRGKLTSCKVLRKVLIPREQIVRFLKATCDQPNLN